MRKTAIFRHIPQGARLSPGRLPEAKKGAERAPVLLSGAARDTSPPSPHVVLRQSSTGDEAGIWRGHKVFY